MSDLGWLFNPGVMRVLVHGLATTMLLAALARMSRFALIRYPALTYIEIVRALPLLLFFFAVYFLSKPMFGINLQPFPAVRVCDEINELRIR